MPTTSLTARLAYAQIISRASADAMHIAIDSLYTRPASVLPIRRGHRAAPPGCPRLPAGTMLRVFGTAQYLVIALASAAADDWRGSVRRADAPPLLRKIDFTRRCDVTTGRAHERDEPIDNRGRQSILASHVISRSTSAAPRQQGRVELHDRSRAMPRVPSS